MLELVLKYLLLSELLQSKHRLQIVLGNFFFFFSFFFLFR